MPASAIAAAMQKLDRARTLVVMVSIPFPRASHTSLTRKRRNTAGSLAAPTFACASGWYEQSMYRRRGEFYFPMQNNLFPSRRNISPPEKIGDEPLPSGSVFLATCLASRVASSTTMSPCVELRNRYLPASVMLA